jgi:hypothetical protein
VAAGHRARYGIILGKFWAGVEPCTSRASSRIVKKLDLAENPRYCQAGVKDAIPTLRRDFFVM